MPASRGPDLNCGNMLIEIKRQWFTEKSTSGILRVDGVWFCWTLEDVARPNEVKIPGVTCIPAGEYKVILDFSQRFQRVMPHVLDVPRFDGIRIHPGNITADTEGCILVGCNRGVDSIWRSKDAFDSLFDLIKQSVDSGKLITLEITNEPI